MNLSEFLKEHGDVIVKPARISEFSQGAQEAIGRLMPEAIARLGEPRRKLFEEPQDYQLRLKAYWDAFNAPDPQTPLTPQ